MLVLTRELKEAIYINNKEIKIRILRVDGNRTVFGIEAPKNICIHRLEVYKKINESSSKDI